MVRPKADLNSLAVPKDAADGLPPSAQAEGTQQKTYAHTLSLRLSAEQYRRLRRYVADQEDKMSKRITHQAIIETALDEYLSKRSA